MISSCWESRSPASVVFALASGAFYLKNAFFNFCVLVGRSLAADRFDPAFAIPNIAKLLLDEVKKFFVCLRQNHQWQAKNLLFFLNSCLSLSRIFPTPDAALNYPTWCLWVILKMLGCYWRAGNWQWSCKSCYKHPTVSLPFHKNLLVCSHHPEWQKPSWDISFGGNLK